jgi:hypothetical protein
MDPTIDLIRRLGQKENSIQSMEFVSPIYDNLRVAVLIEGLVHRLTIPKTAPGWYRLKPLDIKRAVVTEPADLPDVEAYLRHLTKIRLVILNKDGVVAQALPLKNNKLGLDMAMPVPVYLISDFIDQFDTVVAGCDGANLWFWDSDCTNDPAKTEYLRERIGKESSPSSIRFKGLTIEEKLAYSLCHTLIEKKKELTKEGMLKKDVEHAGGQFVKFSERRDHYSVTYKVDGQQYTSYVSKDRAHSVLTAGICLRGGDRHFDLTSLISVLREGQRRDLIHRYDNTRD